MALDPQAFSEAVKTGVRKQRKSPELVVGDNETFGAMGLDSLDVMSMVLDVESALGVNFGEIDLRESDSITTFMSKANAALAS